MRDLFGHWWGRVAFICAVLLPSLAPAQGIGVPPLFDPSRPNAGDWIAIVTDDATLRADCRVLRFMDTMWLSLLAGLAWERAKVLAP